MKGCPLKCLWCSNPESQKPWPEVAHRNTLCNKCGKCQQVCEARAISMDNQGVHINRTRCISCGKCVEVCSPEALKLFGKEMSVEEVFQEIQKDVHYYQSSGGGITISGGEPLYQPEFTATLLKLCQKKGIHTCIETSGYAKVSVLETILPYTSLVLFDLKHMDPVAHRKLTAVSNKLIMQNLKTIISGKLPVIIRIPMIPGLNDSHDGLTAFARTVSNTLHLNKVDLLPYHRFGIGKYQMLDRRYRLIRLETPTEVILQTAKEIFESFGIICEIKK
jgi:pyruvate formate lyase activating enzyme